MKQLFFELGTEEIPARFMRGAERELGERIVKGLDGLNLEHGAVKTWVTPRRLAVAIDVAESQPSKTETLTGPPARIAFDGDGNPTKAALGFAKRNNVDVADLKKVETERGEYLAATVHTVGQPARELLPAMIREALTKLHWPKPMRWGNSSHTFIRPVQWFVALLDGDVLPLEFCDIASSNTSRGHRFMAPDAFEVTDASQWEEKLRAARVEPNADARAELILTQSKKIAASVGGELVWDDGLLEEVSGLVEWAVPLLGTFDEGYLAIPDEVLITSMKVHQKYFAVRHPETGALLNHFVVVAGTEATDPSVVAYGNQRVLAARLADAKFFFELDKKTPLQEFTDKLAQRTFLKGLGTMRDKAARLEALAPKLAEALGNDTAAQEQAAIAGRVAKADLSTGMVGEFASLQGVMGWHYANHAGLPEAVAVAIKEHYWPKFSGDALPSGPVGVAVSLADKLDSIVGCFCLGLEPTGSADPYALRRQAVGVLRIAEAPAGASTNASLSQWLDLAHAAYGDVVDVDWPAVRGRILDFMRTRLKGALAADFPTDLTEAVLSSGFDDPADARGRLAALHTVKQSDGWEDLAIAFKRVFNIVADQEVAALDPASLTEPRAKELAEAYATHSKTVAAGLDTRDYPAALEAMVALKPAIDAFFDDVMVNSQDPAERTRRVALVGAIAAVFSRVCDFTKVST